MNQPLVSILIPFKNTEQYLPECISSILKQEYTNWEVIAINDTSWDDSKQVLETFSQEDKRIKVYDNTGSGIIEALRLAYALCSGDLITRMDSDDIMTSNKLRVMVDKLLEYGKGNVAVGKVKYFSENGISNGYERYEKWLNSLTQKGTNYTEIYKECVIPSPCWMVFKSDFDLCEAFNPNRYPEDYDLTFRFYKQKLKCIPCNDVLHLWRDYATRTSRTSEHYAQNYFLDIKLHYFLMLEHDKSRPLVIWGAGNKGKTIAKGLLSQNIPFTWICDNPKKVGKSIYGVTMMHFSHLSKIKNPQSIITVANEEAQKVIKGYFDDLSSLPSVDYFFFC